MSTETSLKNWMCNANTGTNIKKNQNNFKNPQKILLI